MRAIWNGKVIAESEDVELLGGSYYFPLDALRREYFEPSEHKSYCGSKGEASYFDVVVDGQRNEAAAWYYAEPYPGAARIKNRVAFWHGVKVTK
jgi:uncharacterized protein (DUF427 family)